MHLPNLRARTYVVQEAALQGLACVEASARRAEEWFFARRWVSIRAGRRLLYWVLDEAESRGFRFRVAATPRAPLLPAPVDRPWTRASAAWAALSEEERRIHHELFPQERALLEEGYDWDDRGVYLRDEPLPRDHAGRILETRESIVYEWARVDEEWTWRRYPLYVQPILLGKAPAALPVPG